MLSKIQRYFNKNTIRADVFISAGGACRPAHYLRKHRLRTFSSPFDWMMCYKLEHIIYFLQNGGQGFFTKIKEIRQNETNDNRFIQDSQTGMVSMHDFLRSQSIEECYTEFIHKHKRRFIQLKNEIKKAKHIVFISNRNEKMKELETFLQEMQKIHNAQYTLINIRHDKKAINLQKNIKIIGMGGGVYY